MDGEKLPGDDPDLRGIAELHEKVLAVFPGVAKYANVSDASLVAALPMGWRCAGLSSLPSTSDHGLNPGRV